MIFDEYKWITKDGITLFGQSWRCESEPDAVLCLVHGLGEHSSRYVILRDLLTQSNLALLTFDLRGHGKSGGKRGHTPSYSYLLSDIDILIENAKILFPGKKIFLYGNSMGGNLVINYTLRFKKELSGVITTAPWLRLSNSPGRFQSHVVKFLHKLWPEFTTIHGIRNYLIQKSRFWDKTNDKLMHRWISVNTYINVSEAGEWALENAADFKYPLLIIHGSFDRVTSLSGSREFVSKANCASLTILDNLCHNIHSENESKIIFTSITDWIKKLI